MRYQLLGRTIGLCLVGALMAGCAKTVDNLKAKGIEFKGMKAMRVYRF